MDGKMTARSAFWMLINGVLVVVIFTGLIGATYLLRVSNATVPSRTITVSGEGKTKISPDIATLNFSVVTQGADPAAIQKTNTEKMNKAIAFLKEQGVASKDIKTSGYNLYPRYRYDEKIGDSKIDGYELSQTVTVTVRDLEKAGTILGGLPGTGVNQIGSFNYSVEEPEEQRAVARQEAFNDAWTKAKAMADAAGVKIARVVTFTENGGGYPIYYAKAEAMGRGTDAAIPPMPTLEPGQEEISVTVSVTFEIR